MRVTVPRNPGTVAGVVMAVFLVLRIPGAHCRDTLSKCWAAAFQSSPIWELTSDVSLVSGWMRCTLAKSQGEFRRASIMVQVFPLQKKECC